MKIQIYQLDFVDINLKCGIVAAERHPHISVTEQRLQNKSNLFKFP